MMPEKIHPRMLKMPTRPRSLMDRMILKSRWKVARTPIDPTSYQMTETDPNHLRHLKRQMMLEMNFSIAQTIRLKRH